MVAAVEGKARRSEAAPAGPRALVPASPEPSVRERETFVLGIFAEPDAASTAIRRLSATPEGGEDILLVSRSSLPSAWPPFDTLWASLSVRDNAQPHAAESHGSTWLARHVERRLTAGASIVVARTEGPERQLAVSRALLDAGCDVLLTHDVTAPDSGTEGNHAHNPVIFR
ncbi:hypothetical protein W911_07925 [Hyphomicrobium nitrativorans NL23]|uniref:Uncharacterized protein n=1 Tax=Hyphomicrobium nitrativorans NL23 TaxID=1029756 RepID=V5SHW6_9HYPH|nr:hypothetical protein [Hyphomicrobium nitrativorans]AHB50092.1 hypothetical protein W911_07925 [Hyphomicrobium nitrativorans NL23]